MLRRAGWCDRVDDTAGDSVSERVPLFSSERERGASALGYVGMFLVAALIIGGLVLAASGVGQTLGCMLTNAITGDNAVCSINDPDEKSMVPDDVPENRTSTTSESHTGVNVPLGVADAGADYDETLTVSLEENSEGEKSLTIRTQKGGSAHASAGKNLNDVASLQGELKAGGAKVSQQTITCPPADSECQEKIQEIYDTTQKNRDEAGCLNRYCRAQR